MSAFICNDYHISVLAAYADAKRLGSHFKLNTAETIGAMLYAENVKSVNARYNDKSPLDGFKFVSHAYIARELGNPVAIIKAARCLDYQSCEHSTWEQSDACKLLQHIISIAISSLKEYEGEAWEIQRPAKVSHVQSLINADQTSSVWAK